MIFMLSAITATVLISSTDGIRLVRTIAIPHDATDASGLTETIPGGVPHNRVGGIGSGIDRVGGDEYILLPDRGPIDGGSPYRIRFHRYSIPLDPGTEPSLVETVMVVDSSGRGFTGDSSSLNTSDPFSSPRYDPEGVRVLASGNMVIAEEYGPRIDEFDAAGRLVRRFEIPAAFRPENFGPSVENEMPPSSNRGRQVNRGFEGLALTPSGRLAAILQGPLIQDGALGERNSRIGVNVRVLEIDPAGGGSRQLVYTLASARHGVSEILAVDEARFLVIERDGRKGSEARFKRVLLADFSGATDVSGIESLPTAGLPPGVESAVTSDFIDLLDPAFGLAGAGFPEKVEGLCFGPDLPDGSRSLLVATDNDFKDEPSFIWVFSIPRDHAVFSGHAGAEVGANSRH